MKEAIRALNSLVERGVVKNYAIGGAIGAAFYIEATSTEDIDVFVFLEPPKGSLLISLSPLYDALVEEGGVVQGEYVVIGGWPIQMLAVRPGLTEDALMKAVEVPFDGEPTRIFTAEHTCAIALQTGRAKDFLRVSMFIEQGAVDQQLLSELVDDYALADKTNRVANWPTPAQ
jgi:hypothetical protein